jgi:hypothetical protein
VALSRRDSDNTAGHGDGGKRHPLQRAPHSPDRVRRSRPTIREGNWDRRKQALGQRRHKDSIHVVTAIDAQVDQFDTFDGPLIRLSGQIGNPPLVIGPPNIPESLFDQLEESTLESLPDDQDDSEPAQ